MLYRDLFNHFLKENKFKAVNAFICISWVKTLSVETPNNEKEKKSKVTWNIKFH